MFAMVVLFGLIHGLVLLPICLSFVGPLPPAAEAAEVAVSNGSGRHLKAVNGANGTTLSRRSEDGGGEASKPLNGGAGGAAGSATA